MKRPIVLTIAAAALLAGSAGAACAHPVALKGHEFAAQTRVTLAQARALALKARPGRIVDQELEKEAGGSGLRYSFDVASHGKTIEVGIDAVTGKVLENGTESAASEAQEAASQKAPPKR
jgi:uncharacterized membrane protein YkoI